MSDHYPEEEEEDACQDYADDTQAEGLDNEDSKVQRKLHLFQCASVQQSIKRLWDLLPKDEHGQLAMEGYVELNLRLQKALTQEFVLERAIDSAIGDWGEDVREGQRSMVAEEFAMFIFELCSLWCGPSVSLLVYLLFLNATFIAVTDARGAHTVGLRPLAAVERLPQPFFDLLSVQGWARQPEDGAGLDEEQALNAWIVRNLSPESEQATRLQVQRQVFQVTHDVRAVLLFQEGRQSGDAELLDLVKLAAKSLEKVSPIGADALSRSLPSTTGAALPSKTELFSQPWCPPMHAKPPPAGSRQPDPLCSLKSKPGAKLGQKGANSAVASKLGGGQTIGQFLDVGNWQPRRLQNAMNNTREIPIDKPPPRGRAYDTKLARPAGRGLVLAGQAAMATSAGDTLAKYSTDCYNDRGSIEDAQGMLERVSPDSEASLAAPPKIMGAPTPEPVKATSITVASSTPLLDRAATPVDKSSKPPSPNTMLAAAVAPQLELSPRHDAALVSSVLAGGYVTELKEHQVPNGGSFLADFLATPPYTLPRHPTKLYHHQTDPLIKMLPQSVVYNCQKWQAEHPLVDAPFERVLRKLPPDIRPSSAGPDVGPMHHPNEPIWFEMTHRLHGILKRQGRRANIRRKRRLRSKLFRGRSKHAPTKRDEGKELREYLDRHKAEVQDAPLQQTAGVGAREPGEFLGRVHEQYLLQRERVESRPFRVKGVGEKYAGKKGVGEIIERKQAVVRPVYVPPPSSMMGR